MNKILGMRGLQQPEWCEDGSTICKTGVLAALDEAHEDAMAGRLDTAISALLTLLKGAAEPMVDQTMKALIQKRLAACLNLRAVAGLYQADGRFNDSQQLYFVMDQEVSLQCLPEISEPWRCMGCQRYIYEPALTVTARLGSEHRCDKDVRSFFFTVCGDCMSRRVEQRWLFEESLKAAARDLFLADALDPGGDSVHENLAELSKMARELGIILPDSWLVWVRSGLATIPELVKGLSSNDIQVQEAAAAQLGDIGASAKKAIPTLIAAYNKGHYRVRTAAKRALEKIDSRLAWLAVAKKQIGRLGIFSLAVGAVLAVVFGLDFFMFYRGSPSAAHRLYEYRLINKDQAILILLASLKDWDWREREGAARILGEIGPPPEKAVPSLIQALEDSNLFVRKAATSALEEIDPNWETRDEAKKAVPALVRFLGDRWSVAREHAAQILGKLGPAAKVAVPALVAAQDDVDLDVRKAATNALTKVAYPSPVSKDGWSFSPNKSLLQRQQQSPFPDFR